MQAQERGRSGREDQEEGNGLREMIVPRSLKKMTGSLESFEGNVDVHPLSLHGVEAVAPRLAVPPGRVVAVQRYIKLSMAKRQHTGNIDMHTQQEEKQEIVGFRGQPCDKPMST